MKTSELSGAELALWVAKAEGHIISGNCSSRWVNDQHGNLLGYLGSDYVPPLFAPHKDWSQGGPLIEKHKISIVPASSLRYCGQWEASIRVDSSDAVYAPTPLIAAMRSLVAFFYGNEVPDEGSA